MFKKKLLALVAAGLLVFSMAACSNTAETEPSTDAPSQSAADTEAAGDDLSGSITLAGSTSMETFVTALSEAFMDLHPDVTVQGEYTGSSAGIESVLAGQCDIGDSSRALTDEEKAEGAVENVVAIDGIAVVVDKANTVTNLTKQQLIDIYTGTITNWSELGGSNSPIVVIGRESGSGTRSAFEEILEVEDACVYASELDSTGAVMGRVAATPGAIGYVSLDVIDDSVNTMQLDGVEATAENITSGDYFLSRPFVMATVGEISEQSELVQALFDYIYSDEGTALVESVGLIPAEQ